MMINREKLEFAITDFCNLDCPLCSQATPLIKEKAMISLEQLARISQFIDPFEFSTIKISGGEPTLHPQFADICRKLREMFPAHNYLLATNGFKLEEFKDYVHVFDKIHLVHYPGRNDGVFERLKKLKLPNIDAITKKDFREMVDIYQEPNLYKNDIYKHCIYSRIKKVVGDRIYPCCVIFGQAIRQNIDINAISAVIDADWRKNLARINIENYCRHCFVNVGDNVVKAKLRYFYSKIGKICSLYHNELK